MADEDQISCKYWVSSKVERKTLRTLHSQLYITFIICHNYTLHSCLGVSRALCRSLCQLFFWFPNQSQSMHLDSHHAGLSARLHKLPASQSSCTRQYLPAKEEAEWFGMVQFLEWPCFLKGVNEQEHMASNSPLTKAWPTESNEKHVSELEILLWKPRNLSKPPPWKQPPLRVIVWFPWSLSRIHAVAGAHWHVVPGHIFRDFTSALPIITWAPCALHAIYATTSNDIIRLLAMTSFQNGTDIPCCEPSLK